MPTEHYGVAVIAHGHRLLLTRRPAMGRLGGLWEFPASRQAAAECGEVAARRATLVACGGAVGALRPLGIVRHRLTHVQLVYEAFIARFAVSDSLDQPCSDDRVWIAAADLDRLALPRAQRRIADLLLA